MKNHLYKSGLSLRSYSLFVIGIIFILILSGCGSNIQTSNESTTSATEEEKLEQVEQEEQFREVTHFMGTTMIPNNPKRIAVLSSNFVDNLFVFDVIPVLATEASLANEKVSSHLPQELYKDVQFVGKDDDFNLEAILAATPDLIIGQEKAGTVYDELSKIAPTVILGNDEWREIHFKFGEILGKEKEAQVWMEQYEEKAAEAKQKIGDSLGQETVAFLRVLPKEFRIHGTVDQRFIDGTLYQDLGLNLANGVPEKREAITLEALAFIDADHFFLDFNTSSQQNDQAKERYKLLTESGVWNQLKAVKKGNIHLVPDWFIQVSPHARSMVIDHVVETLLD